MEQSIGSIAAFTAAMACAATIVALGPGVALGWWLARHRFFGKPILETLVTLPLVMPPVATGLILLRLLGRRSPVGRALDAAGIEVVFTWRAVLLAMAVMSLPLIVLTVRAGFEQLNPRFEQLAATLGAGPARVFFTISLPLAGRSVAAAALLGFARALGEFGATIMVAGAIPGQTQTLAVAIYTFTETGRETQALQLVLVAAALSMMAMLASTFVLRQSRR
jgi:molybdate transport system permease protein